MKTLLATAALLGGLTLLSGTASAATPYECQLYAQQIAEQQYPTGGGALGGGVFGGILGAGIAAATGNKPGTGAAIGATAGLVVGSSAWQAEKRRVHDLAYSQCISGAQPAYAVPPPAYGPPAIYPTGGFNAVILGSSLNVRSGPGTQYGVVGAIYANQVFQVVGCGGGWCQLPQGGFVSQPYIRPI